MENIFVGQVLCQRMPIGPCAFKIEGSPQGCGPGREKGS